jgi:hypothetical protein
MEYRTAFDIAQVGYKNWTFPALGLVLVAIGAALVIAHRHLPGWWGSHPRASRVFGFAFLGFALVWTVVSFELTYREYSSLVESSISGEGVGTVEGRVSNFRPMPAAGHSMERFCVESKCFEYSDYVLTAGFNNTSSHGGPIREGLPVRVTYVYGTIIRLEVALEDAR